jgi:hypothetical protein
MDIVALIAAALGLSFAAGITYQQYRESQIKTNQHITKAIALSAAERATFFQQHAAMGLYDGSGRMLPLDVVVRASRSVC